MTDQRIHDRFRYFAGGKLHCRGAVFICRVQNISLGGALISIDNVKEKDISIGDSCVLQMYHEIKGGNVVMEAKVVHHSFSYVGMAFKNLDREKMTSLEELMRREKDRAQAGAAVYCF